MLFCFSSLAMRLLGTYNRRPPFQCVRDCLCCFPAPFHSFPFLWLLFPALPFAFFPVFASPPLPCYPMPFLLPFPFPKLIDTTLGRRHSNCTILTVPFSWSFRTRKLVDIVYTCYLHIWYICFCPFYSGRFALLCFSLSFSFWCL